ncbi:MAG: hypothetical protein K8U03_20565 [Planctomycetia bacterium]|nr:hypothetical protein [Planctomycetia bacterium]
MTLEPPAAQESAGVDMPAPTAAPLVLSLGIVLMAAGVATNMAFLLTGGVLFVVGLGRWISQLLPHRGHCREALVEPALRPRPVVVEPGAVERMRRGMPGYRLRLPEKVHPLSAGVKGGIVGGLVMPLPALVYGVLSGRGIWYPINLLSGMLLPNVGDLSVAELERFSPSLLLIGVVIHATISLMLGLIYGVLMPMLPHLARPIAWGALLMPLLWTAVSYSVLGVVNRTIRGYIEWPWFVLSQLIFGVTAAIVFMRMSHRNRYMAGFLGGLIGGAIMPIPAVLWSLLMKHGIWYPVNLLAAMGYPNPGELSIEQLESFHPTWLAFGVAVHLALTISFGLAFALVLPRMPSIPGPIAWGGLLMPLLWTASSYGLMGVVNPVLQQRVDWAWFVVSQFVFGVVAAIVVVRSEEVHIPPAGRGAERTDYIASDPEAQA